MNSEHKKYILDNIGKKSIKNIAGDLGLKEKAVRHFIEQERSSTNVALIKGQAPIQTDPFGPVRPYVLAIILAFAVMAVYSNTLLGKFVWDDQTLVVANDAIRSFKNIPFIFSHDFIKMLNYNGNVYRPMQELTYMVDFFLYGMSPAGFHLTNIILQAGCALLLFYVVLAIFGSRSIAFLSALIFGIHPVNTEAVSYISGRSDPLFLLFLLGSFLLYIRSKSLSSTLARPVCITASIAFYCLSLLSRETALLFPIILIIYELLLSEDKNPRDLFKPALFVLAAAVFLAIRSKILPIGAAVQNQHIILKGQALPLLPLCAKSIVKYLYIMMIPVGLHMWNVQDLMKSALEREFIPNILAVLALAAALISLIRKDKRSIFWFLWFLVFLIPHTHIIPLNAPFAEHWIFASSIGIYVIASAWLFRMVSKYNMSKWTVYVILSLVFIYLASLTIARNTDWRDEPSIYNNTLKYARFSEVLSNLGVYYATNGKYDKSIEAHKEALSLAPNNPFYHNNIALVYYKIGRLDLAAEHCKESLRINQDQPAVRELLGRCTK